MLQAVVSIVIVALVVATLPVMLLVARRVWLARLTAAFDCSILMETTPGSRWVPGVGRFRGEEVWWYPIFGWTFAPVLRFPRDRTVALPGRDLSAAEAGQVYAGYRIIPLSRQIGGGRAVWDLAMDPETVTAMLSWLEAAPPGMGHRRHPEIPGAM